MATAYIIDMPPADQPLPPSDEVDVQRTIRVPPRLAGGSYHRKDPQGTDMSPTVYDVDSARAGANSDELGSLVATSLSLSDEMQTIPLDGDDWSTPGPLIHAALEDEHITDLASRSSRFSQSSRIHPVATPAHAEIIPGVDSAVHEGQFDNIPLLQQTFITVPTESRQLAALKDISVCILWFMPYVLMKIVRFILARFGVSEHRWKGVPNDIQLTGLNRRQLAEAATSMIQGGNLDIGAMLAHSADVTSSSSPTGVAGAGNTITDTPVCVVLLQHVQDIIAALEITANKHKLQLDESTKCMIARKLGRVVLRFSKCSAVNTQDALQTIRHVGKTCLQRMIWSRRQPKLLSAAVKDYKLWCLMRCSLRLGRPSSKPLMALPEGRSLVEHCQTISLDPGIEYLKQVSRDGQFDELLAFMSDYPVMRPSDVKKEWLAQAMTINGRCHSVAVKSGDGQVHKIATHVRCGAFAVHGRKPKGIGLSGLVHLEQELNAEPDALRRQEIVQRVLGYRSPEALGPEIRIRSACCVSQALPVIMASLQQACQSKACWSAASRTGSFLHVQQSLLSDLNTSEHSYLQDTKGALDILSSRVEIRFASKPISCVSVDRTTQRITLTLDSSSIPDSVFPLVPGMGPASSKQELLSRVYRITALLFSQGVNVLQSIGFFKVEDTQAILQDKLNQEAADALNAWAARAGLANSTQLLELNKHLSKGGLRYPKDTQLVHLVRRATTALGGFRAVNCKSGKDRTAIEISICASEQVVEAGWLTPDRQPELQAALQAGLSYNMTGENNGLPNAYAFTELELGCMPPGWRPPWHLCGKALS